MKPVSAVGMGQATKLCYAGCANTMRARAAAPVVVLALALLTISPFAALAADPEPVDPPSADAAPPAPRQPGDDDTARPDSQAEPQPDGCPFDNAPLELIV